MANDLMTKYGFGKSVGTQSYSHVEGIPHLPSNRQELVAAAELVTGLKRSVDFNVVRVSREERVCSFLSYPRFFQDAFPSLARSWRVDVETGQRVCRNYEDSLNPPILHRKELLLPPEHPERARYSALTEDAERVGLFDDPVRIGFQVQWNALLKERGFQVVDHHLVPIGNDESLAETSVNESIEYRVSRHLTALSRAGFSAPIQMLDYYGFLDGSKTVFDYGCGKGDDLRGLIQNGIPAQGWDPHFAADNAITDAHLVNLGFVINVIEDPVERREALTRAYSLTNELLVVSVMLAAQAPENAKPFADGVLTSRNTFQKYYTQAELREYLRSTLEREPIPVAPGVFFVFKDDDAEQRFRFSQLRSQIRVRSLIPAERRYRETPEKRIRAPKIDAYEQNRELFDGLWNLTLELGREPEADEVENLEAVEAVTTSLRKALRLVLGRNELGPLEQARRQRADDLLVYLAQQQFEKRKPYKHLEKGLQRDIKAFFGDYSSAQNQARALLLRIADPEVIETACKAASENGLGFYEPGQSLQLHGSLVNRLPAVLRSYVDCASVLYGDASQADLIKIHTRSGKVSLMKYDDFLGSPLPRMMQRVKINLRKQQMDVFEYGAEYAPPPLYLKSRYINEELPAYATQLAFDEQLESLNLVDLSGYGPSETIFQAALQTARWEVHGFSLRRSQTVPDINALCGRFLTYRDLIECGDTRHSSGIPNLPHEPDSYTALYELAVNILDPVIEYFGMVKLTYGFCSPELAKLIPARIAPELDQHAAHEKNRRGSFVCKRRGAAVDFIVEHENMEEVANWISTHTAFDRLYFYGVDKPIHVTYGPDHSREFIQLCQTTTGRLIPRKRPISDAIGKTQAIIP